MKARGNPVVSVIIPCHERTTALQACLQSVADQTFGEIQTLLVDDASQDSIREVVDQVDWGNRSKPHYIRLDANVGPGGAREAGRVQAVGSYICYLDSDDVWHEEKVAKQVKALENNHHAGMCYCASSRFLEDWTQEPVRLRKGSGEAVVSVLPHILRHGRPWHTSACMWTRKAVDCIGPWYPARIWEDYEYDSRAGCYDVGVIHIPEVLCFFQRVKVRQTAEQRLRNVDAILKIAANLEKWCKWNDPEIRKSMLRILYLKSLHLHEKGEDELADEMMTIVLKYAPAHTIQGLLARIVKGARDILGRRLATRLGHTVKHTYQE